MKLTSSRTQLPYEYYSLPFCKPENVVYKGENLGKLFICLTNTSYISLRFILTYAFIALFFIGEVLRGDRIVNTLYNVEMGKDKKCEVVCNKKKLSVEESKLFAERVQEEYYVHL